MLDKIYPIEWAEEGNSYSANLSSLQVEITEEQINPQTRNYSIVIKDHNGQIIEHPSSLPPPRDFEEAQHWVNILLTWIDLPDKDAELTNKRYKTTLELCQRHLPENIHPSHRMRLRNLIKWIEDKATQEWDDFVPIPNYQEIFNLQWVEENGLYTAETPFGQARIEEVQKLKSKFVFGGSSRFKVCLEHPTGARLQPLGDYISFENAESWLKTKLSRLLDPRIMETNLDEIGFTLAICKHILPEGVGIFHYLRLNSLRDELELVLP